MRKLLFLVFVAAGTTAAAVQPSAQDQSSLLAEIVRLEAEFGGRLGFMAKNLSTGETVRYNATERFPTASVIKLPVMAAFFHLVDEKKIDPGSIVTLREEDKKPGSGILQYLSSGDQITLLDAVKLMITLSDNSATNLVLDRLAPSHAERMSVVNDFLLARGLRNTKILNRLYSPETKLDTGEALRYGIGVSTPEDMVALLEALHNRTLASAASCDAMFAILKSQFYDDMIPRLLPQNIQVAHKTGFVNETRVDVGLIQSDKSATALAIFVDKHPDHAEGVENRGTLLAAMASRAVWNHFTGSSGYEAIPDNGVDWTTFRGGRWAIFRSPAAPFPHGDRAQGYKAPDGTFYPYHPHYDDNSVVVVVPQFFREGAEGSNVIVHFHGHMNDNLGALEKYGMAQALIAAKTNALLVLPQGPYRARDSCGGKMEDAGGLSHLVDDVLSTMKNEHVVQTARLNKLIISAHSGGYRAAALALARGGLADNVTDVFLFDALYGNQESFREWLMKGKGVLHAAYTEHLAKEQMAFEQTVGGEAGSRLRFTPTAVDHDLVIQAFFSSWLSQLGEDWMSEQR